MRTVLCYGDSNTHGFVPGGGAPGRYPPPERWPNVIGRELGPEWWVVEEGLGGRTTAFDDPVEGADKNGRSYLRPCLYSHEPLDLVVLMLGTNDLKSRFGLSPSQVANGIGLLVQDIREVAPGPRWTSPEIVIVSPPPMLDDLGPAAEMFAGAVEKSHALAPAFQAVAQALGVHFFDAGSVAACDARDGFHIGAEAHRAIGVALARRVESLARFKPASAAQPCAP